MVANIISAMVKDSHFPGALKEKIGTSVDAAEMEKRKDGCWIKNIVFNFPVPVNGEEVKELPLENGMMLETVVLLSHKKPDGHGEGLVINESNLEDTDKSRMKKA